jgi:hypothetical protein
MRSALPVRSDSRSTTLSATSNAAAKNSVAAESGSPVVVAEADASRRALVLTFYAHPAGDAAKAPVPAPGVIALVRLDDGRSQAVVPSWKDHTYTLLPGDTITLNEADAPLQTLRVTVAIDAAEDVDPDAFVFRINAGEHTHDNAC